MTLPFTSGRLVALLALVGTLNAVAATAQNSSRERDPSQSNASRVRGASGPKRGEVRSGERAAGGNDAGEGIGGESAGQGGASTPAVAERAPQSLPPATSVGGSRRTSGKFTFDVNAIPSIMSAVSLLAMAYLMFVLGKEMDRIRGSVRKELTALREQLGDSGTQPGRAPTLPAKVTRTLDDLGPRLNSVEQYINQLNRHLAELQKDVGALGRDLRTVARVGDGVEQVVGQVRSAEQLITLCQQDLSQQIADVAARIEQRSQQQSAASLSQLKADLALLRQDVQHMEAVWAFQREPAGLRRFEAALEVLGKPLYQDAQVPHRWLEPLLQFAASLQAIGKEDFREGQWFREARNQAQLRHVLFASLGNHYAPLMLSKGALDRYTALRAEVELFQRWLVDEFSSHFQVAPVVAIPELDAYNPDEHDARGEGVPTNNRELHNRIQQLLLPGIRIRSSVVQKASVVRYICRTEVSTVASRAAEVVHRSPEPLQTPTALRAAELSVKPELPPVDSFPSPKGETTTNETEESSPEVPGANPGPAEPGTLAPPPAAVEQMPPVSKPHSGGTGSKYVKG